ncbi:MAG: hypothetical protein Q9173_003019 [Seirophora scorigena]
MAEKSSETFDQWKEAQAAALDTVNLLVDEDSPVWDRRVHKAPEWLNKQVFERFPERAGALKKYEVLSAMHNHVSARHPDPQVLNNPFHLTYLHIIHKRPRIDVHMLWKHILQLLDGCIPDFLFKHVLAWNAVGVPRPREVDNIIVLSVWDNVVLCLEMALETALLATIKVITEGGALSNPTTWHVADSIRDPLPMTNVIYERLAEARVGLRAVAVTFQILSEFHEVLPYPRKDIKVRVENLRNLLKSELFAEVELRAY